LSRIKAGMSRGCAARTLKEGFCILGILTPSAGYAFDPDPISLNRIRAWIFTWSMILSETRFPLFRIMLGIGEAS